MLCILGLGLAPRPNKQEDHVIEVKGKILDVDDSDVVKAGVSAIGQQKMNVEILKGDHKGQVTSAYNPLVGNLEFDYYYKSDEVVLLAVKEGSQGNIEEAKVSEVYRFPGVLVLGFLFAIALLAFAGAIGFKALLSFVLAVFIIWQVLIPLLLKGYPPIPISLIILWVLSAVIIFSVTGLTKKGATAFIGVSCGLVVTLFITLLFGAILKLNGMTAPYAETIMFSGYFELNFRQVFYVAILIGSSGAAMDIAMDVASSCYEVQVNKPDITAKELLQSGLNVGRDVIGTMTTTLLLAYSGSYLTLLMLFQVREATLGKIVNMQIVVAEFMRTLVGSLGLIMVAPITAVTAAIIMTRKEKEKVRHYAPPIITPLYSRKSLLKVVNKIFNIF